MRRLSIVLAVLFSIITFTASYAQQTTAPGDAHETHHPGATAAPSTPAPGRGADNGMMPMEMCRQMMMGGMMGGGGHMMGGDHMMRGMMGMSGTGSSPMDPKMMAEMMEMRGEMMKAMGDIMIKHAKKMGSMAH